MLKRLLILGGITAVAVSSPVGYLYIKHQQNSASPFANYLHSPLHSREYMINKLKNGSFEFIVIGGGATGSAVALDAATRGIECAMIEENDFGSATSGKSTKLLHGGVRYLESAFKRFDYEQFKLVCEALEERAHMMKCAPFMSKPVPIVLPLYNYFDVAYFSLGLKLYDLLASLYCGFDTGLPNCYRSDKSNTLKNFPLLDDKGLKGSVVYYDGQHNDTRMNLHLALTSTMSDYVTSQRGATIANYVKAIDVLKGEDGELIGVRAKDKLTNEEFDIFGKVVINCTGPFADEIRKKVNPNCESLIVPTSGAHIVLPKLYSSSEYGIVFPHTSDDRILYCLPWEDNVIAGTTDNVEPLTYYPIASTDDVAFISSELSKFIKLDEAAIKRDIKSTWSGLRPLVHQPGGNESTQLESSQIVRSHLVMIDKGGLISILGGKWTTCRQMAQDVITAALKHHSNKVSQRNGCCTKNLLIVGSVNPSFPYQKIGKDISVDELALELCSAFPSITTNSAIHLIRNYGYRAFEVCALGKQNSNLMSPIIESQPYIKAEIIYSIRTEMARLPSDVIGRRTRLAFVDIEKTEAIVEEVIDMMKRELNWTAEELKAARRDASEYVKTMHPSTPK